MACEHPLRYHCTFAPKYEVTFEGIHRYKVSHMIKQFFKYLLSTALSNQHQWNRSFVITEEMFSSIVIQQAVH